MMELVKFVKVAVVKQNLAGVPLEGNGLNFSFYSLVSP